MSSPWFTAVTKPGSPVFVTFLDSLRDDSRWRWSALGPQPDDTSYMDWDTVLVLMVDVPRVGAGYRNLQIGFAGTAAECGWGDDYVLDGFVDAVDLQSPAASATGMAEMVGSWARTQLRRPVVRDEWLSGRGEIKASRWRLSDTSARLGVAGSVLRRALRSPSRSRRVDAEA